MRYDKRGGITMKMNTEEILNEIIDKMQDIKKIRANDIPNIDLYMDQVTTFMDEKLRSTVRKGEAEENILTKTMINNYAKNDLLPPPVKKKYSREHMMVLIFVYYFKSFLTISDIETLLNPITEQYFAEDSKLKVTDIYEEILKQGMLEIPKLEEDLRTTYEVAQQTFPEESDEDAEYLRLFAYICYLSYDVFVKKMLIERLLDEVSERRQNQEEALKKEKSEQQKREKEEQKREKEEAKREKEELKREKKNKTVEI